MKAISAATALAMVLATASPAAAQAPCTPETFASLSPSDGESDPDISITTLEAMPYTNLTVPDIDLIPTSRDPLPPATSACILTLVYTHPGRNDTITTWVSLPLAADDWNSRFMMYGGSGWLAGDRDRAVVGSASGFASASTDGGHAESEGSAAAWALTAEGALDAAVLEDFASRALIEAVGFGKRATELYFRTGAEYSYWVGCSTGGRQGNLMAQRIPGEFDGIVAGAPAINWQKFIVQEGWGYVMASILGVKPPTCVFQAFTAAAVDACDELDGVKDGMITLPDSCDFKASSLVGSTIHCSEFNASVEITRDMASLVDAIWTGPETSDGQSLWYGLEKGTNLAGEYGETLLTSNCTSLEDCSLRLFLIAEDWIRVVLKQNNSFDITSLSQDEYVQLFMQSVKEYTDVIGTDDPDLSQMKNNGTKLISWHGTADPLIAPKGTSDYYERVVDEMGDDIDDFYRLFFAPGLYHCARGPGLNPVPDIFFELAAWVENGTAPDTIGATGPAVAPGNATADRTLRLCQYPKVLVFNGTDPNDASHFTCESPRQGAVSSHGRDARDADASSVEPALGRAFQRQEPLSL